MRWLAATVPPSGPPTLVHNDFKLDNVMLDPGSPIGSKRYSIGK